MKVFSLQDSYTMMHMKANLGIWMLRSVCLSCLPHSHWIVTVWCHLQGNAHTIILQALNRIGPSLPKAECFVHAPVWVFGLVWLGEHCAQHFRSKNSLFILSSTFLVFPSTVSNSSMLHSHCWPTKQRWHQQDLFLFPPFLPLDMLAGDMFHHSGANKVTWNSRDS